MTQRSGMKARKRTPAWRSTSLTWAGCVRLSGLEDRGQALRPGGRASRRFGRPAEDWASRYGLGLSQLNLGETKASLKAFAEAREDFDALGDQNMVAQCDERFRAAIWLDRDAVYD